jgi:hypothetical protein
MFVNHVASRHGVLVGSLVSRRACCLMGVTVMMVASIFSAVAKNSCR